LIRDAVYLTLPRSAFILTNTCSLDEFLQDLELSITQETREQILSSAGSLNFAQAALLLQQSSVIYSGKVDYLYSSTNKMQEDLVMQYGVDAGNKRGGRKSTGIDPEIEAFLNYDPHQDFLPLNDVLPIDHTDEGTKINLSESAGLEENLNLSTTAMRLSIGTTRRASWDSSLLDQSARVNVAAQRALFGTLDAGTLHLVGGACDIGQDGVLRIPGGSIYEPSMAEHGNDNRGSGSMDTNDGNDSFGGDDGVGFELAAHDDNESLAGEAGNESNNDQPVELGKRVTFAPVPPPTKAPEGQQRKVDHWELLDRDTPDGRTVRPLRIGKTIVLPEGVDKPPSEYVPGSRTGRLGRSNRVAGIRPYQTYNSHITETFHVTLGKRTYDSRSQSVSGLAFGNEFAYIAEETAKRKAEEKRALHRQQQLELDSPDPGLNNCNYDGAAIDFGSGDYDDNDDFDDNFAEEDGQGMGNNTGIAAVDDLFRNQEDHTGSFAFPLESHSVCTIAHLTFFSHLAGDDGMTFEELCRAHIQAFARGAEKYAAETKLSARVEQWQVKLLPILDEEGQRPGFDIHDYGASVVRAMEKSIRHQKIRQNKPPRSNVIEFCDITRECEQYDVCRMFLATLSLSNSGNVSFAPDSTLESLKVNLLSSDIERPTDTYIFQDNHV
jgi:condensin-2 complex subunit H2